MLVKTPGGMACPLWTLPLLCGHARVSTVEVRPCTAKVLERTLAPGGSAWERRRFRRLVASAASTRPPQYNRIQTPPLRVAVAWPLALTCLSNYQVNNLRQPTVATYMRTYIHYITYSLFAVPALVEAMPAPSGYIASLGPGEAIRSQHLNLLPIVTRPCSRPIGPYHGLFSFFSCCILVCCLCTALHPLHTRGVDLPWLLQSSVIRSTDL